MSFFPSVSLCTPDMNSFRAVPNKLLGKDVNKSRKISTADEDLGCAASQNIHLTLIPF